MVHKVDFQHKLVTIKTLSHNDDALTSCYVQFTEITFNIRHGLQKIVRKQICPCQEREDFFLSK